MTLCVYSGAEGVRHILNMLISQAKGQEEK